MAQRCRGQCKWFNSKKGYGFITTREGEDVFVHQSTIKARGFRSLLEGEDVEFDLARDNDGKNKAINVTGPAGDYVRGDNRRRNNSADFGNIRSGGGGGGGGGDYGGRGRGDYGGGGGGNYRENGNGGGNRDRSPRQYYNDAGGAGYQGGGAGYQGGGGGGYGGNSGY